MSGGILDVTVPHPVRLSLRCARCGDVIGAYEPMVVVDGDHARQTSAAADPGAVADAAERYHDACFAVAVPGPQAA